MALRLGMLHNTNHRPLGIIEQCLPNTTFIKTNSPTIGFGIVYCFIQHRNLVNLVNGMMTLCFGLHCSQWNLSYLADGNDEGRQHKHGHSHPGDVGLESPWLGEVTPALELSRGHFGAGEDEHLPDKTTGQHAFELYKVNCSDLTGLKNMSVLSPGLL